jgi:uncharacterized protein (TIGR03083 family)
VSTIEPTPDPDRAPRLLLTERDALIPLLRELAADQFDRPTVLPGWSVRDVLAHCSGALGRTISGRLHAFTPEDNQGDVDERRPWPIDVLVGELEENYAGAAEVIRTAGGRLDALALGEWIHGGDVREAVEWPGAYVSAGVEEALVLLVRRSHDPAWPVPPTEVRLDDASLQLGPAGAAPVARLETDRATLIRICAGRAPDPSRYRLDGARVEDLLLFR